jgi:hypothetical protein
MKTMVHSNQLQFTRDGKTLVIADPDAVTLVGLSDTRHQRIPVADIQSIAGFADQVWVATRSSALIRFAGDGRRIDEHPLPTGPEAALVPTTIGPPAALWTAREPVLLADDLGSLAITPARVDAIPVSGRRFAHYAGLRLTLPGGAPATLAPGLRIAGGVVVFEGSSLALVVEHITGRDLVVVALASGRLLQRVAVPPGAIRIAARRGLAVVHETPRRLAVFDLRFARHLGAAVTDGDVADVAIDPDGERLAIRLASGELELAPIGGRATATRLSV